MSRFEDLTGQTFGRLKVLYRSSKVGEPVKFMCQCECGNLKEVRAAGLKRGSTKSCGCFRIEKGTKNKIDLIGKKFNRLTVLEETDERKNRQIVWKCKCDCGKIKYVTGRDLREGRVKSCGCLKKDIMKDNKFGEGNAPLDITGKRFGKLVAIKSVGKLNNNDSYSWLCKCDCGNECVINIIALNSNSKTHCGCERHRSSGEIAISSLLKQNDINFVEQYSFNNCIFESTKRKAVFDFFVDNKYLIEFDGEQHFKVSETSAWKEKSKNIRERDAYKNKWCKENNIPLIRIPYTHLKNLMIEDLLLETTQFLI